MSEQTDKDLDALEDAEPVVEADAEQASEFDAAPDPEPPIDQEAPADGPVAPLDPEPSEPA